VNTYSIVARDAATGEMGVAVQSHWFSVGSMVSWAEPGVGAVATQSFVDPNYGPLGLQLMRGGKSASEALQALLAIDEHANVRQVGMVDADGVVATHTGQMSIDEHWWLGWRRFYGPGKPDVEADGLRGDGGSLRRRGRRPGRAHDARAGGG
jgi:uncharacterized Ntn-hydrolase superfamily protein